MIGNFYPELLPTSAPNSEHVAQGLSNNSPASTVWHHIAKSEPLSTTLEEKSPLLSNDDDEKHKQMLALDLSASVLTKLSNLAETFDFLQSYDATFTMKSKLYLDRIKRMLPPAPVSDGNALGYLSALAHPPLLPLSNFDRELIEKVRSYPTSDNMGSSSYVIHVLEKLLVSLVNKIMVLILLEYDTWALRGVAKDSVVELLIEVVFPASLQHRHEFRQFFRSFIDLRLRNFRDSMSRYYRDLTTKSKPASETELVDETKMRLQYKTTLSQDSMSTTDTLSSSEADPLLRAATEGQNSRGPLAYPPLYRCLRPAWASSGLPVAPPGVLNSLPPAPALQNIDGVSRTKRTSTVRTSPYAVYEPIAQATPNSVHPPS